MGMDVSGNGQLIASFHPRLRENITQIFINGRVGVSSINMKVKPILRGIVGEDNDWKYIDEFILEIPYAGKWLSWEVIFSSNHYEYGPDFIFVDDLFMSDPDLAEIENIPSLAEWNVNNSNALINIIKDFLVSYRKYQVETLETKGIFTNIYNSYVDLINSTECSESNTEVYIEKNNSVHFVTSLEVDITGLPEYMQLSDDKELLNSNEDTAILRVIFHRPDGGRVKTDLQLSPRFQQLLGPVNSLHIPNFSEAGGLKEHVLKVKKLLQDQILKISTSYQLRNEYISEFLSLCSYSVVDYDSFNFSKLTFLYEVDEAPVLVQIDFGRNFPQDKPMVRLSSPFSLKLEKPIMELVNVYPYSSDWGTKQMIEHLLKHLEHAVPKFLNSC